MHDLAGHIGPRPRAAYVAWARDEAHRRRRRRRARLAIAFYAGLATGALIALITRALADERAGVAPFASHAVRHAAMIGLLTVAAALVAVVIQRSARR